MPPADPPHPSGPASTTGLRAVREIPPGDLASLPIHELANVLPGLNPQEMNNFKADLAENGQQLPAALWRRHPVAPWVLLDGIQRMLACRALGRSLLVEELPDGTDPGRYVASTNIRRRHLTPRQAIRVFDELVKHSRELRARLREIEGQAKARRAAGLKQGKARSGHLTGTGPPGERVAQKAALIEQETGKSVSPATVRRYEKRQATPPHKEPGPAALPRAAAKLPAAAPASKTEPATKEQTQRVKAAICEERAIRARVQEPVRRVLDALDHLLTEGLGQLKRDLPPTDHEAACGAVAEYLDAKAVQVRGLGKTSPSSGD
jgi:hypothetical protein